MSSSPCAACKFLRRKCTKECEFSPYFPPDNPKRFADVHKLFGASNVAKILREMEPSSREDAVQSLAYEAESRLKDPVYGCVGHIYQMQTTLQNLHTSLEDHKKVLASIVGPTAMFQMLHDPTLRAMYQPFASSSNPSMLVLDHQQQYKVQQEQYQRQQQIGAHVMQQCLQQSERQQHHKEQLLERQMQVTEQQKQLHGGAVVIRDANVQFQQVDSKEETPLQFMSYDEIHQQAQMKFLQEQREAELMRLHEHQLRHNAMNPYNVQQQEQQQPLLMLQQQPELQQQEQQEIQDLQLFQDHNLYPPEPENGV